MEDLLPSSLETALESALETASDGVLDPTGSANGLIFLAIAAAGLAMALVYVPLRLYLTATARSRRLKLLQRIRRLREELSGGIATTRGERSGDSPPA
jgi:hypothetical protein